MQLNLIYSVVPRLETSVELNFFLRVCVRADFKANGWNKGSYLLEEERL